MHEYMIWATRNYQIYPKVPKTPMLDWYTYILIAVEILVHKYYIYMNGMDILFYSLSFVIITKVLVYILKEM